LTSTLEHIIKVKEETNKSFLGDFDLGVDICIPFAWLPTRRKLLVLRAYIKHLMLVMMIN
jgi:hypothetical protein